MPSPYWSKVPLAPLKSFDAKVFVGDANYPQSVCDVILGFALIYNDVKDTLAIIDVMLTNAPMSKHLYAPEWGEYYGRDMHIFRHHVALLHELFIFIAYRTQSGGEALGGEMLRELRK